MTLGWKIFHLGLWLLLSQGELGSRLAGFQGFRESGYSEPAPSHTSSGVGGNRPPPPRTFPALGGSEEPLALPPPWFESDYVTTLCVSQ